MEWRVLAALAGAWFRKNHRQSESGHLPCIYQYHLATLLTHFSLEKAEDLCRKRKPEKAVPYLLKAIKDHNNLDALIQVAFLLNLPDAVEALESAELRGILNISRPIFALIRFMTQRACHPYQNPRQRLL